MDFFATIFLINCLWLVGCLPIVTVGTSTAAMCQTYFRIYSKREEKLFPTFWSGFKSNFKQATLIWIVYLVFLLDVALVLWSKRQYDVLPTWFSAKPMLVLISLVALIVVFTAEYIFAVIAYYDCTTKQAIVNALGISFRNPSRTLLLILMTFAAGLMIYYAPFMALIAPASCSSLQCKIIRNLFMKQESVEHTDQ